MPRALTLVLAVALAALALSRSPRPTNQVHAAEEAIDLARR